MNSTNRHLPAGLHRFRIVALVLGALAAGGCNTAPDAPVTRNGFSGSGQCASCHPQAYADWQNSHHAKAMQLATPQTVLADFDSTVFVQSGDTTLFLRRGDRFVVWTAGADGRMAEFTVAYTFGLTPLQQYLIDFPDRRLQCLTIAWDTKAARWFSLYPDERIPPGDPLHWTGLYQNWNHMCAACHSTDLTKGYDAGTDSYNTTWAELSVGCEACHGPAARHAEAAESGLRTAASASRTQASGDGLTVRFGADPGIENETCAPCHSRRTQLVERPEIGAPFLDQHSPELIRPGIYHADGQIRQEVYVYGSFIQSRMAAMGVRCSDCHNSHSLQLRVEGDGVCLQCHTSDPPPRFPTLKAKRYDEPGHTFHPAGSEGARCISCHMPATTYMQVDPRHDHAFKIPRPGLTEKFGIPNACNGCHADKTPSWASQQMAAWYGVPDVNTLTAATAFARSDSGQAGVGAALSTLAIDPMQRPIVRASALARLAAPESQIVAAARQATADPDALVRAAGLETLLRIAPEAALPHALDLLGDPIRVVRIEAARIVAKLTSGKVESHLRAVYDRSLAEYRRHLNRSADLPSALLNLAILMEDLGRPDSAVVFYRRASTRDISYLPAYQNLANLLSRLGRNGEAESVLRSGLRALPYSGHLHYSLGLLLAETAGPEAALPSLAAAAAALPKVARVHYNHGLALQQAGDRVGGSGALSKALDLEPENTDVLYALAVLHAQDSNWDAALRYARRLQRHAPPGSGAGEFVQRLEKLKAGPATRGSRR